jgi:hypothetical protein
MRRRLRRQRRVREALLLDLGALVYELHRQGKRAPALLQEKAGELGAVDDEVRGLEEALGDGAGLEGLLAMGIVGSCASCGALLNAGDGFCARCGAPARVRADAARPSVDEDTAEFDAGEDGEELGADEEEDELGADEEEEEELAADEEEGEPATDEEEAEPATDEEEAEPASAPDGEGPRA